MKHDEAGSIRKHSVLYGANVPSCLYVPKSVMTGDSSARDSPMHYHTAILKPVVNIISRSLTNLRRESRVSRTLSWSFRPSALICLGDTCPEHQPSCQLCRQEPRATPSASTDKTKANTAAQKLKLSEVQTHLLNKPYLYRVKMTYACQL